MGKTVERLKAIIKEYEREHYLCGSLLIEQDGEILLGEAFGEASIQLGVPNRIDTRFHIASVTKSLIATAVMSLVEKGNLDLNERPCTYIKQLQNLHPGITIHHLLNHTSGLHDIYAVPNLRFEMDKLILDKGDFLTYLSHQHQQFAPGEQWSYSSTGFILLGYIMEAVTGRRFGNLLDDLFFNPLTMNNSGEDDPKLINSGRAYGHTKENGTIQNAKNDKLSEIDAPRELYSTVGDLNKWCKALFSGQLLSSESMDKMFTPYFTTTFTPELKYGYGWFLGDNYCMVAGGTPGFRSEIWYFPEEKLNVIMLWNYEKVDSFGLFSHIKPVLLR